MRSRPPGRLPLWTLALSVAFSAAFTIYGGIRAFYYQSSFLAPIAYTTDERPTADTYAALLGVKPDDLLMGIHVFFDFLVTYSWGTLANPWLNAPPIFPVNYPPGAMAFMELWALFPYKTALAVYLPLMALCLVLPMFLALRRGNWEIAVLAISVTLLSGPAIASLDRGNTQGFLPLLLFAFAVCALKDRWGWASLFLVIAASMKIFPAVLLLVLAAERRWRAFGASVVTLVAIHTLGFLMFPGDPIESFRTWFTTAFGFLDRESFSSFLEYNASFTGGVTHGFILLGFDGLAAAVESNARLVAVAATAVLASIVFLRKRLPLSVRIFAAFMMTTTILPIAYPYSANWIIAGAALMFWLATANTHEDGDRDVPRDVGHGAVWVGITIASALLLAFAPVFIPGSMESGFRAGVASLLMPAAVMIFVVSALLSASRHRSSSPSDPSNVGVAP